MKHKTILLLLLAVVISTGCSKREQAPASYPTVSTTENASSTESDKPGSAESQSEVNSSIYTEPTEETTDYYDKEIECEPIDSSLDCEAIILEKADRLYTLISDYRNLDSDKLKYTYSAPYCFNEYGDITGAKVISGEMSCYADFKALFSDSIYGDYLDYLNQTPPSLFDIDGELYGTAHIGGFMGTDETWYLGHDVQENKIVGHFAELQGLGEPSEKTAEYLNDESNYRFYDITVQCVNGVYVVTSCRETSSGKNYDYSDKHGMCYNSGFADRSLITNEKVAPKIYNKPAEETTDHDKEYEHVPSDTWLQNPSADPVETVRSALEGQTDKDYTITLSVEEIRIDEDETARVRAMYSGSELAAERGWTDEYLAEHFIVVWAKYYAEYDHTKTFLDDGYIEQYFQLTQDTSSGEWTICDNSSPDTGS